jgi:phenylacetate-CoA ligase
MIGYTLLMIDYNNNPVSSHSGNIIRGSSLLKDVLRKISLSYNTKHIYLIKYLLELKTHQRYNNTQLLSIQLKKLRHMISHAYDKVPYYKNLFDTNKIIPDDIKSIEDLQYIPITTKKDIQANYDNILATGTDPNQCKILNTTGSTGIPLKILKDKKSIFYSSSLVYFSFFEAGLGLFDRIAEITGTLEDCSKSIINKKTISVFDPTENIINGLNSFKPDILYSYPSVLNILSHYINYHACSNPHKSHIKPKVIITHGETLTDLCRINIMNAFGVDVLDTYGSTEFNRLGFECEEHKGIHMITDCAVIEIIKDGKQVGPGEEGEIVVTGLYNYAMPLIRYRLGDIGIHGDCECPCGRGWPIIKRIVGRSDDYLVLQNGRHISPRNINIIENIPGIVQYRIIQKDFNNILVQIVPSGRYSSTSETKIREQVINGCNVDNIIITIELVKDIPKEKTGKIRTVISHIHNNNILL